MNIKIRVWKKGNLILAVTLPEINYPELWGKQLQNENPDTTIQITDDDTNKELFWYKGE
jgi:hypothetical protein